MMIMEKFTLTSFIINWVFKLISNFTYFASGEVHGL